MTKRSNPRRPAHDDIEAFQDLLQRVEVLGVQLLNARVVADRSFIAAQGAVDGNIEVTVEVEGGGCTQDAPPRLECEMKLTWSGFLPGGETPLVQIEEVYLLTYRLDGDDPIPESTLQLFVDHNAAFNVWPFFRASLHATTLRMGLPAYTLPLLKPIPKGDTSADD